MASGMSENERQLLRKEVKLLKENLELKNVLSEMRSDNIFDRNDEEQIDAEITTQDKISKFLQLLPRRGPTAFNAFLVAVNKVQPWLGKILAAKAGINLEAIVPAAEEPNPGMQNNHREILRCHLQAFIEKLDVEQVVKYLSESGIIYAHSATVILQESSRQRQVEIFIQDVLPKCGPNAFDAFYIALKKFQPAFAHNFEQLVKGSHPSVVLRQGSYQESNECASNRVTVATTEKRSQKYQLSTPCSELPEELLKLLGESLDEPSDMHDTDWRRLYKELELPEGKIEVIARKNGSPTKHTILFWTEKNGRLATIGKLLAVLMNCERGGLAQRVENILGIEGPAVQDVVDAVADIHFEEKKPIRKISEIPQNLKPQLINRLDGIEKSVLDKIATAILDERCYVRDGADFLQKLTEKKTRILFRELCREKQEALAAWMRKNFPAGSTGPMKNDDEEKTSDMNYGYRKEVTDLLTAHNLWKQLASHKDINMKHTNVLTIDQMRQSKDPSEQVLSYWEVSCKSTAGTLYDLLVDCGFNDIADRL